MFEPLKFYCIIIWAETGENLSSGFPTKGNSNQQQRQVQKGKGRVTDLFCKWPTFAVKIDCKEILPKYYQVIPKSL